MSPNTIRVIDRWVGIPVCWCLTGVRRLLDLFRRPRPDAKTAPRKILFIKLVELGANVQAYAALQKAAEIAGRDNLFFWVFEENRPILDILEVVPEENLLVVRNSGLFTFVFDILRTLLRVRRLRVDAAVDMEFLARASAILAFLSGAKRRVGLHRFTTEGAYRGDLMTHRIQNNPYVHVSRLFLMMVEALTTSGEEIPLGKEPISPEPLQTLRFRPTPDERARVNRLLQETASRPVTGPLLLLNPNASDIVPLRRWPTERFVETGRRLLAGYPEATVAITGSPSEHESAQRVVDAIDSPRALNLAGKTTLRDLIVLYCLADLLITNDSGPGQFASMTPIDVIVLFGPETPQLWKPLGTNIHAMWKGLACSPCVTPLNYRFSPCTDPRCMLRFTVEEVVAAAEVILKRRLRGAA